MRIDKNSLKVHRSSFLFIITIFLGTISIVTILHIGSIQNQNVVAGAATISNKPIIVVLSVYLQMVSIVDVINLFQMLLSCT